MNDEALHEWLNRTKVVTQQIEVTCRRACQLGARSARLRMKAHIGCYVSQQLRVALRQQRTMRQGGLAGISNFHRPSA